MWDVIMDKPATQKKLEKEVERLRTFLQLSERRRLNEKILYEKNLQNLHEKLADFEKTLRKEQKEVQARLQSKHQQIKVREDLAKALQNKLDSQYCTQCGYPNNKNKFDGDWQVDMCLEKKAEYRKLPLLSLPLPENLPNVTFSNRQLHCKSKLSPVAEECEVASSSYLRNIHADQHPDRFHAVLTASLECLQVRHVKKNITPESEYVEDELNDITQHKINPHKSHLEEALEDKMYSRYHPPRPSISIQSGLLDEHGNEMKCEYEDEESDEYGSEELGECDKEEVVECDAKARELPRSVVEYADSLTLSILHIAYTSVAACEQVVPVEKTRVNCIESFSSKIACNIISNMPTYMLHNVPVTLSVNSSDTAEHHWEIHGGCELASNELADSVCNPALELVPSSVENNSNLISEYNNSCNTHISKITSENGYVEEQVVGEHISDAYDTGVCNEHDAGVRNEDDPCVCNENGVVSPTDIVLPMRCEEDDFEDTLKEEASTSAESSYLHVSTLVVPLVDQAMEIAKNIVRRRSSTNISTLDSTDQFEENGELEETQLEDTDEKEEESVENLSFNRKTLIELIDQAVENVIPNVNCWKDNDVNSLMNKCAKNTLPNNFMPSQNGGDSNGGAVCKDNVPRSVEGGKCLTNSIPSDTNVTENKENQSKSKKKKNKKKKKKKKGIVSDAGNRFPESVEEICVNTKENVNILTTIIDCGEELTFDFSEVVSSSLNNSQSDINISYSTLNNEEDKFSLTVDESFNEMEASRGSTPDTLDGFQ